MALASFYFIHDAVAIGSMQGSIVDYVSLSFTIKYCTVKGVCRRQGWCGGEPHTTA